jgi:tetratricopeptide (TPR) repeat protein
MVPPVKYFKDYAHHRGYIGTNLQKKNLRNMSNMLKEYRENPDDLSNILQIEQAYGSVDLNIAMEYIQIGLKKSQEIKSLVLEAVFRSDVCYIYYRKNEYQEAYDFSKESIAVFDKTNEFFCVCADIFATLIIAAQNLKKEYSEIKKTFDRFMEIYEGFKAGTFMTNDMMVKSALFLQLHPSQVVLNAFCLTAIENGEFKEAKRVALKKEKPSVMLNELNTPYTAQWLTIMRELKDYSYLPELIHDIITSDVDEAVRSFLYQALLKEISIVKDPEKNLGRLVKIINEGISSQEKGSFPEDFILLMKAFDNFYNNGGMTSEGIIDLFADTEKFSLLCADIVPLLADFDLDLSIITDKFDFEFINESPQYILAYSENLAKIIINYTSKTVLEKLNPRVQLLLINISIFLLCSLSEDFDFDTDKITNIISTLTACYLESAYTSEVISEENSEHMSLPVRIGFYLFLSRISLADGDIKASVMYLRKLLSFEPRLKEYISRELEKIMGRSPRK